MLTKALHFVQRSTRKFDQIKWFYRAKPHKYFTYIFQHCNGIMNVYLKSQTGDAASIINGTLSGLFFGCNVNHKTGYPPQISKFGPQRLYVPVEIMMFPDSVHLYFADFYCLKEAHYVTLVMTVYGSKSDKFCHEHLIRLNTETNEFLVKGVTPGGFPSVFVTRKVLVEVLYTEDIDLHYWMRFYGCYFDTVLSVGTSRLGGIPKKVPCSICNL